MICVTTTPLAKIFQKQFYVDSGKFELIEVNGKEVKRKIFETVTQMDLIKDPTRIFKPEKFSVTIDRPSGAITFWSSVPRYIADPDLRMFLTGGEDGQLKQETEFSGVVQMPMEVDGVGALMGMVTGTTAAEDIKAEMEQGLGLAVIMSKARVMNQVRNIFTKYKRQLEKNKEQALGAYQPSPEEFLCMYVLDGEEKAKNEDMKDAQERIQSMLANIQL